LASTCWIIYWGQSHKEIPTIVAAIVVRLKPDTTDATVVAAISSGSVRL
jgi:hypothetical protein